MRDKLKGQNKLIIDLRGNGGGYVKTLEAIVGHLFDTDIKIADIKGRKIDDKISSKSVGEHIFKGKIVVLIDSRSGSASEIFSRLMQIEERGTVLGDVSAGAVMQSMFHTSQMGVNSIILYGANITNADVIITDGKSLEHVGVIPDEKILTTGKDIFNERDPVMARAFEILGTDFTPEQAGKLFPVIWQDGKKGNVTAKTP